MKSPVAVRVSFNTLSASESAFAPEVAASPKAEVALFALSIKVCVPPTLELKESRIFWYSAILSFTLSSIDTRSELTVSIVPARSVTDCFNTFETDSDAMDEKVLLI